MQEFILTFTKPNYIVYDPWATIGSTILANTTLSDQRVFFYDNLLPAYANYLFEWYKEKFSMRSLQLSTLSSNKLPEKNIAVDFVLCQIIFPENVSSKEDPLYDPINFPLFSFTDSFLEYIYKILALGKYAVFSISNTISKKNEQSNFLYHNRSFYLYKHLIKSNFIPKAEIIWQQPYVSSNGINDTRIWVVRKEIN